MHMPALWRSLALGYVRRVGFWRGFPRMQGGESCQGRQ